MTWAELKEIIDSMGEEELKKNVILWDTITGQFSTKQMNAQNTTPSPTTRRIIQSVSTLTITDTKEKNMINLYDFCKASAYTDTARHVEFEIFHEEDETFSNKMQANFTNILQYATYEVTSIMPKGDKLELIIQKPNCEESVK